MNNGLIYTLALALLCFAGCARVQGDWTKDERALINSGKDEMRAHLKISVFRV